MQLLSDKKWVNSHLNLLGYQVFRYIFAKILSFIKRRRTSDLDVISLRKNGYLIKNDFLEADQFKDLQNCFTDKVFSQLGSDNSFEDNDTVVIRKSIQMTELEGSTQIEHGIKSIFDFTTKVLRLPDNYRREITLWFDKIIAKKGRSSQNEIHTDTYHNAYKVWYFPLGVKSDQTPLVYYSRSHKISFRRALFEYQKSLSANPGDELSWRLNSSQINFFATQECMTKIICKPNTLLIVNVHGFHHRDISDTETQRAQFHFSIPRIPSDGL